MAPPRLKGQRPANSIFKNITFIHKTMEAKINLIDPLMERAEQYGKTSMELIKLKTIEKTSDIASGMISRFILIGLFLFAILLLNISASLYLGDMFGKIYLGFLVMALFYGLLGLIISFFHVRIKQHINNLMVAKMIS
jgi:uncharacterized protein YqhQ